MYDKSASNPVCFSLSNQCLYFICSRASRNVFISCYRELLPGEPENEELFLFVDQIRFWLLPVPALAHKVATNCEGSNCFISAQKQLMFCILIKKSSELRVFF